MGALLIRRSHHGAKPNPCPSAQAKHGNWTGLVALLPDEPLNVTVAGMSLSQTPQDVGQCRDAVFSVFGALRHLFCAALRAYL